MRGTLSGCPRYVPPWFLNTYAAQLAPILQHIFQLSVDSSQVPEAWKNANVTAIYEKGSRAEAANYRPISLTSVASKLLEHIIHSHVMKHLEQHNILTDSQHGFRAKRSTETQLIQTIHDISKSLDKKEIVDMAILDFTKAFDKVPHKRLIHKLNYYGITGSMATWIETFLTGRTQQVVVNGATLMTLATRTTTSNMYTFCGQTLTSVNYHCHLGIHLANTLNWTNQTKVASTKAQQTLGVIRRHLNKCPTHIKAVAYTSLVRPILEYASAAWDPHSQNNINTLERIQRQAARFCKNNYSREPGSVTKFLQELGWETLQARRKHKIITTLYKMEHNIIDIPLDQYIIHNTRCSRKHNSQFLQIRHSSDTFGKSVFRTTAKEWNALPSYIISSS